MNMFQLNIADIVQLLMELVAGAGGVYLATEVVKNAKNLPFITKGNAGALRATAGIFSAVGVLVLGVVDQNLRPEDVQTAITAILSAAAMWSGATAVHENLKKEPVDNS